MRWPSGRPARGWSRRCRVGAGRRGWPGSCRPCPPSTRSGRHRGRPRPSRDADRLEHGLELRAVPAWPAVTTSDSGRCPASQARCSLVVSPPRDRPRPWSLGSMSWSVLGGSTWTSPFAARRRRAGAPGRRWSRLTRPRISVGDGAGLQLGEQPGPGAVALPGAEQAVAGLPGPVPFRDVAPRRPGADPPADAVDDLPAIPRPPPGRLDRRQHLFQHLPLRLGQITTSHALPNERTRSQTRSRLDL